MLEMVSPPLDHPLVSAPVSGSGLVERYVECRRREAQAAGEAAELLGEIVRRGSYRREGYLSATAFVAHQTGDSHQAAAGRVKTAKALQNMPGTAQAYREGDIDTARVRRLTDAHQVSPEQFTEDEELLVDRACHQDAAGFTATIATWSEAAAAEQIRVQERELFERRHLTMTDTFWGTVHLQAELDPLTAETISTAIGTLADGRDGSDGRSPAQRRVDALGEICRRHLDAGDIPISNGRRPHLEVIVDLDTLTGSRSQIGHQRPLGPAARETLACDATICGVLMDGPHRVLQMGRNSRTATPAQHRALAIRDQGCTIPGCDRPPDWCDAHHLTPWTHNGHTNLDNLTLICRPHHTMHHHGTLQLPQQE